MIAPEIIAAFEAVETAVDNHPRLKRREQAHFDCSREGYTMRVGVTSGRMRKMYRISAYGETLDEAAKNLIEGLDHWAQSLV